MFLDFKENIELLEKVILNFVLTPDDNDIIPKPKNLTALSKTEILAYLKSYYFTDEVQQDIFKVAKQYFKEYKRFPTKKEIKDILALQNSFVSHADVDDTFNIDLREYSYPFLYNYTQSLVLYKNFNSALTTMATDLKTQEITPENINQIVDKVRNDLSTKLSVSFSTASAGLDFFNVENHIQPMKTGTPSGIPFIDKVLDGGWAPKTLVVFQGRPKVGKSYVLANVAARAVLRGVNVGVASFELSKEAYTKRIGSNLLDIPYKEYNAFTKKEHLDLVNTKLQRLVAINPNLGSLNIAEFATGSATALDIENYFLKLEQELNKKFNVIVVDYLNIMRPINPKEGMYEKIKTISEELRAIAIRNEWTIVSATQVKREAVGSTDMGMEDVAESFGLIHTVDTLFGLMRGPLEKVMKIKVIANRDGGYTESYQRYNLDYDHSRLVELSGLGDYFYSDEDSAADLKEEMVTQYNNLTPINNGDDFGIFTDSKNQHIVELDEPAPEVIPEPPKVINSDIDYDDILNSIT